MSTLNYPELIAQAHATAREKGWWDGDINEDGHIMPLNEERINEIWCNFHAEVSEAWECYRANDMNIRTTGEGKLEGFPIELADIVIRMFDFLGAFGGDYSYYPYKFDAGTIPDFISQMHEAIVLVRNHYELGHQIAVIVSKIVQFCERKNIPLEQAIIAKMAYNKTRSYRHGGKVA
jgi:hypothetical protein